MYKNQHWFIIRNYGLKAGLSLILLLAALLGACNPAASPEAGQLPSPTPAEKAAPTPTQAEAAAASTEQPAETSPQSPVALPGPAQAEPDGRTADFPNTIIVYQREGRLPDSPQEWTFYHTGLAKTPGGTEKQLEAGRVKALFERVEAPDFWSLAGSYAAPGQCQDCLIHTLIVYGQAGVKEIKVTGNPPDLPENLKQILAQIETLL